MIHNRKARITARRTEVLERARQVLQEVVGGSLDPYEGYRRLYGIYIGTSGLAEELKPFFRLAGVEPDGAIHVDDQFRATIRHLADDWLRGGWPLPDLDSDEEFEKLGRLWRAKQPRVSH